MIYMDRDADLNTPATTPSGCVDGMVVSHLTGRGAAEMVRFWGEPPLVREPDLALFGVARLDPAEEEVLQIAPLRRYLANGRSARGRCVPRASWPLTAFTAMATNSFLHLDVDVIADFQATNYPGTGGLTLEEVREALSVFAVQKHLAAIEVTAYNPTKDPDGSGAKLIVDLLVEVLEKRLETLKVARPLLRLNARLERRGGPVGVAASPGTTSGSSSASSAAQPNASSGIDLHPPAPGEAGPLSRSKRHEPAEDTFRHERDLRTFQQAGRIPILAPASFPYLYSSLGDPDKPDELPALS